MKLLTEKEVLRRLALTLEQIRELSREHPFPLPVCVSGEPRWFAIEVHNWAMSLPREAQDNPAENGGKG